MIMHVMWIIHIFVHNYFLSSLSSFSLRWYSDQVFDDLSSASRLSSCTSLLSSSFLFVRYCFSFLSVLVCDNGWHVCSSSHFSIWLRSRSWQLIEVFVFFFCSSTNCFLLVLHRVPWCYCLGFAIRDLKSFLFMTSNWSVCVRFCCFFGQLLPYNVSMCSSMVLCLVFGACSAFINAYCSIHCLLFLSSLAQCYGYIFLFDFYCRKTRRFQLFTKVLICWTSH